MFTYYFASQITLFRLNNLNFQIPQYDFFYLISLFVHFIVSLTHLGWVMNTYASVNQAVIGSEKNKLPVWGQAIIWTKADIIKWTMKNKLQ